MTEDRLRDLLRYRMRQADEAIADATRFVDAIRRYLSDYGML